jgi:hypothetical protein
MLPSWAKGTKMTPAFQATLIKQSSAFLTASNAFSKLLINRIKPKLTTSDIDVLFNYLDKWIKK